MRVELSAAGNRVAAEQADAVLRGAEQYVLARVDAAEGDAGDVTSSAAEAVLIKPARGSNGGGYFWIIRPTATDSNNFEYGIVDEASKINLNTADLASLAKLPGVSKQLAACINDWRDDDSEITEGGGGGIGILQVRQRAPGV